MLAECECGAPELFVVMPPPALEDRPPSGDDHPGRQGGHPVAVVIMGVGFDVAEAHGQRRLFGDVVGVEVLMPVDRVELGKRCRRLRVEILKMTLHQAADRTGIDEERLENIERGEKEPTGDEVLIIADAYRERIDYFLMDEGSASIDRAVDLYRMYGDTFSSQDRQSVQEFLSLCRMEHEIEDLLGGRPRTTDFRAGKVNGHMKTAGRETAERLRSELGLGSKPIEDPFDLARRLRCHVFRRKLLNSRISGVMLRHEDFGPCILVNYVEGYFRQNFSVAHELCHALLDGDRNVSVTFERGADDEPEELRRREWRANAFAEHLLLPDNVRRQIPLGETEHERVAAVAGVARQYHINPIVVLYALQEARRLTEQEVQLLRKRVKIPRLEQDATDMETETAKRREARTRLLERGLAPAYVDTCLRAYREGEISYGRLADALLVSAVDVADVVSDFGFDVQMLGGEAV